MKQKKTPEEGQDYGTSQSTPGAYFLSKTTSNSTTNRETSVLTSTLKGNILYYYSNHHNYQDQYACIQKYFNQ